MAIPWSLTLLRADEAITQQKVHDFVDHPWMKLFEPEVIERVYNLVGNTLNQVLRRTTAVNEKKQRDLT
jgi:hypothetical protein